MESDRDMVTLKRRQTEINSDYRIAVPRDAPIVSHTATIAAADKFYLSFSSKVNVQSERANRDSDLLG